MDAPIRRLTLTLGVTAATTSASWTQFEALPRSLPLLASGLPQVWAERDGAKIAFVQAPNFSDGKGVFYV
jgi:CelD/BcsL family acetyltransferase involved in cellulose biosynthesis